jgi:hypothetical protein
MRLLALLILSVLLAACDTGEAPKAGAVSVAGRWQGTADRGDLYDLTLGNGPSGSITGTGTLRTRYAPDVPMSGPVTGEHTGTMLLLRLHARGLVDPVTITGRVLGERAIEGTATWAGLSSALTLRR